MTYTSQIQINVIYHPLLVFPPVGKNRHQRIYDVSTTEYIHY